MTETGVCLAACFSRRRLRRYCEPITPQLKQVFGWSHPTMSLVPLGLLNDENTNSFAEFFVPAAQTARDLPFSHV